MKHEELPLEVSVGRLMILRCAFMTRVQLYPSFIEAFSNLFPHLTTFFFRDMWFFGSLSAGSARRVSTKGVLDYPRRAQLGAF